LVAADFRLNAGCGGGFGEVDAAGQGVDDLEHPIGKVRVVHRFHFRLYDSLRAGESGVGGRGRNGCSGLKRQGLKNIPKVCDRKRLTDVSAMGRGHRRAAAGLATDARRCLAPPFWATFACEARCYNPGIYGASGHLLRSA